MGLTRFERDIIADALIDKPYHAWIIRDNITEYQLEKINDVFETYTDYIAKNSTLMTYRAAQFWKSIHKLSPLSSVFYILMVFDSDNRWTIVTKHFLQPSMKEIIKDMDTNSAKLSFEACYK